MSTSVQDWSSITTTVPPLALSLGTKSLPASPNPKARLIYGESNARSLEYLRKREPPSPTRADPAEEHHQAATLDTATAPTSPMLRPGLIRKKSGELVKSSLKIPMIRTKSLPNTKNVHFATPDALVDVRRFNGRERPVSVSLSESDTSDSDDEDEDEEDEWVLQTPNFTLPKFNGDRRPDVYLESVYLASNETVKGSILVRNLGFSKHVVVRYSANYWASAAEVEAAYTDDIRKKDRAAGFDRFLWELPLRALPLCRNSYNATAVFFAIRYSVNHQELWDNNQGMNYELSFKHHGGDWAAIEPKVELQNVRPQLSRVPSYLAEENNGTPKLRTDAANPLKSRYSFGTASSTPRFGGDNKSSLGGDSYEDILQRYCFYTPSTSRRASTAS